MGLKIIALHRAPLEWHYLRTKCHENLPSSSKVIRGTHIHTYIHTDRQTDRQTGDLISLLSFLSYVFGCGQRSYGSG
jgi:hypothetical protein